MINILLTGVGGQGTVLAAKVLAQTANDRGWHVRTAETIGMAQRGGSVVSHVRMGNEGETVSSPLIPEGCADMVIAFEPAEGARCLKYLTPDATLVTASTGIPALLSDYSAPKMISQLEAIFKEALQSLVVVDDAPMLERIGNRRTLNIVLLASAISTGKLPITIDDLRHAVEACVKPGLVDINQKAIDAVISA